MQRPLILASCLGATALALYSCSMHASVTTDGEGRIVELSSLRLESSLSRWAIEMLVVGGQLAVELRSVRPAIGDSRTRTRCDDEQMTIPGALIASA